MYMYINVNFYFFQVFNNVKLLILLQITMLRS